MSAKSEARAGSALTLFDTRMMRRALALAARGRGTTRPNPMVGCVITLGERVLAEGWHHRPGGDHAEIAALRQLDGKAEGATFYVTLEPCDHTGRTGPCTKALIAAGARRVVYATRDPNPKVDGRGRARLRRAGIAVEEGLLGEEARALNRGYAKWITTGRPWVTLKAAVSLDGRIATRAGDSKWITGGPARRLAHQLRAAHDAILVGAGTVRADDPQLTVRGVRGRDPQRVILDGRLRTAPRARAVPGAWVLTGAAGGAALRDRGATVIRLGTRAHLAPAAILRELGRREISSVLIEGGGVVHGAFLRAGLVDEVAVFVAPVLIGGDGVSLWAGAGARRMTQALRLTDVRVDRLGDDVLVRGRPALREK
jgi:diaminohydroxyphosphoribosylaminopyrimidine deaminase/5-amino-6-(5-phosphoribosylamino)uracil reductase